MRMGLLETNTGENKMDALVSYQPKITVIEQPASIDYNPAAVYLSGLKESGRRSQRQVLNTIAEILTGNADCFSCNWASIRFQHVSAIRSKLSESKAPATVNKALSALRRTLRSAWQLDQMSAEDYHKAASVENVKNDVLPAGRGLSKGEIAALIEVCQDDRTAAGSRDVALIALMYVGGLRRTEVINLDLSDYNTDTAQLVIRGKGNKERTVYLANGATLAMTDWLGVRGLDPGALFLPINKGGAIGSEQMTAQAIYNILSKRADQAGVRKFSPHDLRRTFITDLLEAGADIAIVAKMAGHANVQTTARYDRRPEEAKKKAAEMLHVPYKVQSLI